MWRLPFSEGCIDGGAPPRTRYIFAARGFGLPCTTDVYQRAFPRALKRTAAAASASRLRRRPEVRAARAWHYARIDGDVPRDEAMPRTVSAIVQRLRDVGSWRVSP